MSCIEVFSNLEYLKAREIRRKGRFVEEENIEIQLGYADDWKTLLILKIFKGRPPYFRKWIEIFNINPYLKWDGKTFHFLGSEFEEKFLSCISDTLNAREWLYIEYDYDPETSRMLDMNVPIYVTRLGYFLFLKGFLWMKNWYYPEGFMEGSAKIQAEKTLSKEENLKRICEEINNWLSKIKFESKDEYLLRCINRANKIVEKYCK